MVDDRHPPAEPIGLLHVVGGEHNGGGLGVQLLEARARVLRRPTPSAHLHSGDHQGSGACQIVFDAAFWGVGVRVR